MDFFSSFGETLADHRVSANLIAAHGIITLLVLAAVSLRHVVAHGTSRLLRWTKLHWLESAGEHAAERVRALILWLTVAAVLLTIGVAVAYHFAGGDVRQDLGHWYDRLTLTHLLKLGLRCGSMVAVLLLSIAGVRVLRGSMPKLEAQLQGWLGPHKHQVVLHRGFLLVQYYFVGALRLTALWLVFGLGRVGLVANPIYGFILSTITILVIARLVALSSRVLFQTLEDLGDRRLTEGPFRHYWERMPKLFPFSERCFEVAVYFCAVWLCVREFMNPMKVDVRCESILKCIGIVVATRVFIELLQVLLGEIFGLYADEETVDQKKRTVAPLLYSMSQYVLYFGAALMILTELGVDTRPVLAGAGILGLAVGLGAQSLVTDVVSGFFILFEGQYLVGDYVQIADASGVVEAVGIRVTHLRDGQGKVFIIPNGQIKGVVSYSKGYVNAVVDLSVPTGSDLEATMRAMAEAGRRLRQGHREVLAETHIHGLVNYSTTEMTVRAVTKVRPGTHCAMQNEYRRLLKEVLDQGPMLAAHSAAA